MSNHTDRIDFIRWQRGCLLSKTGTTIIFLTEPFLVSSLDYSDREVIAYYRFMSEAQHAPFAQIKTCKPVSSKDLLRSPGQSPISWETIVPARRRERTLEGVLVGCGVAEAVAHLASCRYRKRAMRTANRLLGPDIDLGMMPDHRFHSMIFTIQALLCSRASINRFASQLSWRLRCYQLCRPFFLTWLQLNRILHPRTDSALSSSLGNDPLPRAAILSVVLQGHSHGGMRWVHRSTVSTHRDGLVAHAAMLVAIAMQRAQMTGSDFEIQRDDCLNLLMEATHIPELRERLIALSSLLAQDQSLESAAELLGFKDCMAPSLVDSALLGIYSWLHHEGDYRSAVEEVVMLGGDSISAAMVAGALAGAELGVEAIPRDWIERTSMVPYERGWRERYIERLRDWPHGPEDILRTRPLPVMRLRQVLRNIQFSGWWITLPLRRLLSGLSRVKRDRW